MGQTSCFESPAGTETLDKALTPSFCPPGTYSLKGQATCQNCIALGVECESVVTGPERQCPDSYFDPDY